LVISKPPGMEKCGEEEEEEEEEEVVLLLLVDKDRARPPS
jgi:hypothetical protein